MDTPMQFDPMVMYYFQDELEKCAMIPRGTTQRFVTGLLGGKKTIQGIAQTGKAFMGAAKPGVTGTVSAAGKAGVHAANTLMTKSPLGSFLANLHLPVM